MILAAYIPISSTAFIFPLTVIVPLGFKGIFTFPLVFGTIPTYTLPFLALFKAFLKTSCVGATIYRAPVFTTPLAPITAPSVLRKYRFPPILLSFIALTVPSISTLSFTKLKRFSALLLSLLPKYILAILLGVNLNLSKLLNAFFPLTLEVVISITFPLVATVVPKF